MALTWTDKRKVLMLSTKHAANPVSVQSGLYIILRRTSAIKEKPTVIVDYNTYMLGVDKMDQLVSCYSFTHKSVKWWRIVLNPS